MISIDTGTPFGARVAQRLSDEIVVWLTTVDGNGTPQPVPVWFLWTGSEIVLFSQPDKPKLRNIAGRPRVTLHFDGNGRGADVVVLTGSATVDDATADERMAYDEKYRHDIVRIGHQPDSFHDSYSVTVRFTPDKLRGF